MIPPCMMMMMQRRYQRHFSRLNHTNDLFFDQWLMLHLICNCHVTVKGRRERSDHIKALKGKHLSAVTTSCPTHLHSHSPNCPLDQLLLFSCIWHAIPFSTQHAARNAETESDPIFCFCILLLLHVQWVKHLAGIVPSSPVRARSAPLPCTPHPAPWTNALPAWKNRFLYTTLYNAKTKKQHVASQLKWNGFVAIAHCKIMTSWQHVAATCCHTAATPPYLTRRSRKAFNDFR